MKWSHREPWWTDIGKRSFQSEEQVKTQKCVGTTLSDVAGECA